MNSHAHVTTEKAVRYMTQLGKHWSHKFPVLLGEADCEIDLPLGRCVMKADAESLDITATAETPEGLTKLEDVIASHLARFAFREGELTFGWTRAGPAGSVDPAQVSA